MSNVYVGTDGKIHVVKGGADTGLNFSSFDLAKAEIVQYPFPDAGVTTHTFDAKYNEKDYAFCIVTGSCSAYNSSSTFKITIDQDTRTITIGGTMHLKGLIAMAYYI